MESMRQLVLDETWNAFRLAEKQEEHGPSAFMGSRLLDNHGYKCCQGFMCLLDGFSEDDIRRVPFPIDVNNYYYNLDHPINHNIQHPRHKGTLRLANILAAINDASEFSPREKYERLKPLFAEHLNIDLQLSSEAEELMKKYDKSEE